MWLNIGFDDNVLIINELLTSTESCKALFQSGMFVIEDS